MVGVYKHSPKGLQRYVDEIAGRPNIRETNTLDQMAVVAAWMGRQAAQVPGPDGRRWTALGKAHSMRRHASAEGQPEATEQ